MLNFYIFVIHTAVQARRKSLVFYFLNFYPPFHIHLPKSYNYKHHKTKETNHEQQ